MRPARKPAAHPCAASDGDAREAAGADARGARALSALAATASQPLDALRTTLAGAALAVPALIVAPLAGRAHAIAHPLSGRPRTALVPAAPTPMPTPTPPEPSPVGATEAPAGGVAALAPVTVAGGSPAGASAAGGRIRIHIGRLSLNVLSGDGAFVHGALRPAAAGDRVLLQLRLGHAWRTVARGWSGTGGRFTLRYVPRAIGTREARVVAAAATARSSLQATCVGGGCPTEATRAVRRVGMLNVYRVVEASWYGGGGSLACGGYLTSSTMGVANKTLPCGTMVTLRYGGREVRVPVIDRGPYVAGREFDLTEATKAALGFPDTAPVWSTR